MKNERKLLFFLTGGEWETKLSGEAENQGGHPEVAGLPSTKRALTVARLPRHKPMITERI